MTLTEKEEYELTIKNMQSKIDWLRDQREILTQYGTQKPLVPKSQMKWETLTDREIMEVWLNYGPSYPLPVFVRAIEDILKERNEKNCTGHRDEHGSRYDPFVRNSGH